MGMVGRGAWGPRERQEGGCCCTWQPTGPCPPCRRLVTATTQRTKLRMVRGEVGADVMYLATYSHCMLFGACRADTWTRVPIAG